MIDNNRIVVITPNNNEQLYRYLFDKFSPCMVLDEPIKGFKIQPIYEGNIEDAKPK
jgi:hypothetical protein